MLLVPYTIPDPGLLFCTIFSFWVLERKNWTVFPRGDLQAVVTAAARYKPSWLLCCCQLQQVSKFDFALSTQETQFPFSIDFCGFELLPHTHRALKRKCHIWRNICILLLMHQEWQIINSISHSPGLLRQILAMQLTPSFFFKQEKKKRSIYWFYGANTIIF